MDTYTSSLSSTIVKYSSPSFKRLVESRLCLQKEEKIHHLLPVTRYYGSKLRLINWISAVIADLNYETVLDAFGGTGTVSLLFKMYGKDVFYNDILSFNSYAAQAVLSSHSSEYRKEEIPRFFNRVKPVQGFIYNTFNGYYYTDEENEWLDGAATAIHCVHDLQFKSDLLYCLFQSCLQKRPFNLFHRKNLYIRTNNNKNTKFGNWKTWERSFNELIIRASLQLEKAKNIKTGKSTVLPPSDASSLPKGYDLVYLDPPYIKNLKNELHYLDRYHFLEGVSNYYEWEDMIDYKSNILSLKSDDSTKEWNHKNTVKERLFDFIKYHSESIIVLSYADDGCPSLDELQKYFKHTFKNTAVFQNSLSHALKKKKSQEIIFLGVN